MARPKEFDVDEAVDAAVEVFWSEGFEATSMQDLVDALGINRGSIYGTFDDKATLYQRALDRYVEQLSAELIVALSVDAPLRERLRGYFTGLVTDTDGRGCFVINTICERAHHDDPIRDVTTRALDDARNAFRSNLVASHDELRDPITPDIAADLLIVLLQGLQVMAKTDLRTDGLPESIDAVLHAIFR